MRCNRSCGEDHTVVAPVGRRGYEITPLLWTDITKLNQTTIIDYQGSSSAMKYSLERAVSNRRTNNLNAIRLVLAVLVILAHCFPLTLGREGGPTVYLQP